jgi:hypothetical protein
MMIMDSRLRGNDSGKSGNDGILVIARSQTTKQSHEIAMLHFVPLAMTVDVQNDRGVSWVVDFFSYKI